MINTDMVDVYKIDCVIRKNAKQTLILRRKICDWLCEFAPTHFISIQFPTNQRSKSMEISRNLLRDVMKYFEKQLNPRHWFKKQLLFIGVNNVRCRIALKIGHSSLVKKREKSILSSSVFVVHILGIILLPASFRIIAILEAMS